MPTHKESVPVGEIVDRTELRATFERMVTGQEAKRLMFVSAPSGRGKTCLLKLMREYCRAQEVACATVDFFAQPHDAPYLTLAREICEQLGIVPRHVAEAVAPLAAQGAGGVAQTQIDGDVVGSQVITQVLVQVSLSHEALQKDYLKQRLKRALAEDLGTADGRLVCLFDTVDSIGEDEEAWLLDALLRPVREGALAQLVVITAGRCWPDINDWEWEDNAHLIYDLPPLTEQDIQEFARRLGYDISDKQAEFYWQASRGGLPVMMGIVVKNLLSAGGLGE